MDVATWCEQNGITNANYYYRLRRVRMACLSSVEASEPAFVELPVPAAPLKTKNLLVLPDAAAEPHCPGDFTLEISNHADAGAGSRCQTACQGSHRSATCHVNCAIRRIYKTWFIKHDNPCNIHKLSGFTWLSTKAIAKCVLLCFAICSRFQFVYSSPENLNSIVFFGYSGLLSTVKMTKAWRCTDGQQRQWTRYPWFLYW